MTIQLPVVSPNHKHPIISIVPFPYLLTCPGFFDHIAILISTYKFIIDNILAFALPFLVRLEKPLIDPFYVFLCLASNLVHHDGLVLFHELAHSLA